MISEGSCDTEYQSNDAGNYALLLNYILKYIKIENCYLNCNSILHNYIFLYFDQINAALNCWKNLTDPTILNESV